MSVVKEGYLTKRAVRGVGSNRRRWITLRENSIEWSERQGSKPLGSMELDGETGSGVSTTRSSLGDGGGGDVYGNREAAEAQKWFRAAGPARYESPPPARPRV